MNKLKRSLILIMVFVFLIMVFSYGLTNSTNNQYQNDQDQAKTSIFSYDIFSDSGLDYRESLDLILNPERGFYQSFEGHLIDNSALLWNKTDINVRNFSLFHLRIGLEHFSTNAGGVDSLISNAALTSLRLTLEEFRKVNATVIVRFSYNVTGKMNSSGKYLNAEPGIDLIEMHIKQLALVLSEFYDILASIDSGMFGPWGEQHSTKLGMPIIENAVNYYRLIEAWLKYLPVGCNITVRKPLYYLYWANLKYNLNLSLSNLSQFQASNFPQYPDLLRIGINNDGYLGSASDLGTYFNRNSETAWLSEQAKYTLFGGEVVADTFTLGLGFFNRISFLEKEAYITKTSYLNYYWNYQKVISVWERNLYKGKNLHYKNKTTEFLFVANHLGYRFVLRESQLGYDEIANIVFLKGKIENVGFGNIVNEKRIDVIIQSENHYFEYEVEFDMRTLYSQTLNEYYFEVYLPTSFNDKRFNIFLKISDIDELEKSSLRTIRFANDASYWNSLLGANFIGEIKKL